MVILPAWLGNKDVPGHSGLRIAALLSCRVLSVLNFTSGSKENETMRMTLPYLTASLGVRNVKLTNIKVRSILRPSMICAWEAIANKYLVLLKLRPTHLEGSETTTSQVPVKRGSRGCIQAYSFLSHEVQDWRMQSNLHRLSYHAAVGIGRRSGEFMSGWRSSKIGGRLRVTAAGYSGTIRSRRRQPQERPRLLTR